MTLPLRFSTDMFEPREKVAAWCDFVGQAVFKLQVEPYSMRDFRAETNFRIMPGLRIISGSASASRHGRPKFMVDNDDFMLNIALGGTSRFTRGGQEVMCGPGDAVLCGGGEGGSKESPAGSSFICLQVPRQAIDTAVRGANDALCRRIDAKSPALRLLRHYAEAFEDDLIAGAPPLHHQIVTHVHDLMAVVLDATRDAAEIAKGRGIRAARLQAIKSEVRESLTRGDLSIVTIAARHRLPVRYVQRLFEEEGTTFTEFVLNERLALAHRILTHSRNADLKISAVAIHAGFGSLSYFNEAFRRRYGASPSDVRAQVLLKAG